MYVSKKVCLWMLISAIIVCIDAFFVINRPETLKGGKYYQYFSLYELYTKYDTLYQMNDDKFVLIQSYLNICEAILTIFGLMVAFSSCKIKKLIGGLVCLVINTMILWKTVIFIWYDSYWTIQDVHNFTPESILCYTLPSLCWIVFPILSIYGISSNIVQVQREKIKTE